MSGKDWLSSRRSEVAADRILDAAGELFTTRNPGTVGMHEIAKAAGCSRATLYRYFENREALHTAFVHREAYILYQRLIESLHGIDDPKERLVSGITTSVAMVRQSPALAGWFAGSQASIGSEIAEQSEVIKAMTAGFLISLGPDEPDVVERRARWLVRVMTSILMVPGRDEADERAMLEEFIVPIVVPASQATQ